MDESDADLFPAIVFRITNPSHYRAALARLRVLESAPSNSLGAIEGRQLELAVSRYLAMADTAKPAPR